MGVSRAGSIADNQVVALCCCCGEVLCLLCGDLYISSSVCHDAKVSLTEDDTYTIQVQHEDDNAEQLCVACVL